MGYHSHVIISFFIVGLLAACSPKITTGNTPSSSLAASNSTYRGCVYASLQELKADRSAGGSVSTLGYYKANDGGGGQYYISSEGCEDGGSCVKLDNGLYAHLIYDRVYKLKQWGITGEKAIRKVFDVYPFLTLKDIRKINPEFDKNTTAETYIIQYLLCKSKNYYTILLDGDAYYINHTLHLKSFMTIEGLKQNDFNNFGGNIGMPGSGDTIGHYDTSSVFMMVPDKPLFDTGDGEVIQVVGLRNFFAGGVFGGKGFKGKYPGDFLKITCTTTNLEMDNLSIQRFANAVNNNGHEVIWSNFNRLYVNRMVNNGLFLQTDGSHQINCCRISNSRFYRCGMHYEGDKIVDNTDKKPMLERNNCILIGGSGNTIRDVDVSHSNIGIFLQSYSKVIVDGTYSESVVLSTIYHHYDSKKQTLASVRIGYAGGTAETDKNDYKVDFKDRVPPKSFTPQSLR